MKHQSSRIYSLTWPAKTARDRIWRAVLVGRYPWSRQFLGIDVTLLWRLMELITPKQINLGGILCKKRRIGIQLYAGKTGEWIVT